MKIVGFTFIRNALKYDYPIVEAIQSILPLCDEVVVAVGESEDATLQLIQDIGNQKIRIIRTAWNDTLREGGAVLAIETNKAFDGVADDADWCIYIQGDEVLPDEYHAAVYTAMKQYKDDTKTEGLLFKYKHFYGSYDYVADSRRWYRHEIRVIKNDKKIRSYRDAQGFRKQGRKLQVRQIDAFIYHYGWVKPPEQQQAKQQTFHKLWHNDEWLTQNVAQTYAFDYSQIDSLAHYTGEHPKVMQSRIAARNWQFSFDPTMRKISLKERLSRFFEKIFGRRFGEYQNYVIVK